MEQAAQRADIPALDISTLFRARSVARDRTDAALRSAASQQGFLIVTGLPAEVPLGPAARRALLRVFDLRAADLRALWRRKFEPANANVYRGWFPAQPGNLTSKEGIDIGADVAYGAAVIDPGIRCASRHRCRRNPCCPDGALQPLATTWPWSGWPAY